MVISFSVAPFQILLAAGGPGYYINGFVTNDVDHPIVNASVKVTNTRTGEYWVTGTDLLGMYKVVLSDRPVNPLTDPYVPDYGVGDVVNASARFNTLGGYGLGDIQSGQTGTTINITIGDISAPSIYHIPMTTAVADEAIVITSDIEDDIEVSDVVLRYLLPGESSYDVSIMVLVAGNTTSGTWEATIPETGTVGSMYYYISANDTAGNNNCSDIFEVDVSHGKADHFILYAPSETTAGVGFNITAVILDSYNNIVSNYTGTVELWSTDPNDISIASFTTYQFLASDEGSHIFQNTILCTPPSQIITINDISDQSIHGNTTIIVHPNEPTGLEIVPKNMTIIAGSFSAFILRLSDEYGNRAPADQEFIVDLATTSSDGTFSPSETVTFDIGDSEIPFLYRDTNVSGSPYNLTASAPALTPANTSVHVASSNASQWTLAPMYSDIQAGDMITYVLRLLDEFGNPVSMTNDTLVNISTTSRTGIFKIGDNTIESVVLKAATDHIEFNYTDWNTANSPCIIFASNGTSVASGFALLNITPAAPYQLTLHQSAAEAIAGTNVTINANILDRFGNICVGLNDIIYLNTTDPLASNQSRSLVDMNQNGLSFNVTLYTAGVQILALECHAGTVRDTIVITIKSGNAHDLELLTPDSVIAGVPFSGVICVLDEFGNLAGDYSGTVSFTSDDPYPAILPSTYTFSHEESGRHPFSNEIILYTVPESNITVQGTETGLSCTRNILILDKTPPKAYFTADNTSLVAGTEHAFTLEVWDDVRISEVVFYYSYDNETYLSKEMNQSSGNYSTGIGNYTLELEMEEGTIQFYFSISDGANEIDIYGDDGQFSYVVDSKSNFFFILLIIIIILTVTILSFYVKKTKRY